MRSRSTQPADSPGCFEKLDGSLVKDGCQAGGAQKPFDRAADGRIVLDDMDNALILVRRFQITAAMDQAAASI
jgi:hypothetical protein